MYSVVSPLPALAQRLAQGRFDFAAPVDPAPASTPEGAEFVAAAPALFACLYGRSSANFHDVLLTRVDQRRVEGFLRGQYANGWRAEAEVKITTDAASGRRQFTLGRSNIPDPPSTGCTLPNATVPDAPEP